MKKASAIGNRKLSDFDELKRVVIHHAAAMRRLRS